MRIRPVVSRAILRLTRWKLVGVVPQQGILVGAPHTSNWDWVATLLMVWSHGVQPRILIKHSFFKGPFGPLLRATGGVPLDREKPGDTIRALLKDAGGDEPFLLAIAAEGTRGKGEYWKAGFYKISQQTGLPITLGFIDGASRSVGVGPTFQPTGDLSADMDFVREFYADKHGIRPKNRTEPRLREEAS